MARLRRGGVAWTGLLVGMAVAAGPPACRNGGPNGESRTVVVPNVPEIPGPDWERIAAEARRTPAPALVAGSESPPPPAEPAPTPNPKPTEPRPATTPFLPGTSRLPPPRPSAVLPPSAGIGPPYELRLTATARQVWLWISVDGGPRRAISLERGEQAAFHANEKFVLSLDDAGGVEATLNGRPLPPFGKPARARRGLVIPSPELAPAG